MRVVEASLDQLRSMERWELVKWAESELNLFLDVNEEEASAHIGRLQRHAL